jgi:hypothetical protein
MKGAGLFPNRVAWFGVNSGLICFAVWVMASRFTHLNDPAYWRERAEELRVIAEHLNSSEAKAMILGCARNYAILAERRRTSEVRAGRLVRQHQFALCAE